MSVHLKAEPQREGTAEESFVGRPVSGYPAVLLCTAARGAQRWCGWMRIANNEAQYLVKSGERRDHEATCAGGLIAGSGR